ncbi:MAG: rRNA pseudouridine synthase [Chitinophagaceae bacterium]|nr:MAG: rRNA pseudouridine synthase [Chitinophagaceae bacterium]
MQAQHRYFMIHKPYGMESQFKENFPAALLGDLDFSFPEGTHAIGRLDKPSEGLLLLTTNKKITKLLFQGAVPHRRSYLVQVRFAVSDEKLQELRNGVTIRVDGGKDYTTPPCEASFADAPQFPSPKPFPDYGEFTWLLLTITEGKYRQVRKMVAAIGHKCFRLIRVSIEDMELGNLPPGGVKEVTEEEFFRLLKLER